MTDPKQSDQQKHWQELAEQLGLPLEADRSRTPRSAPPPSPPSESLSKGPPDAGIDLRGRGVSETCDEGQLGHDTSETTTPPADVERPEVRNVASSVREERRPQERKPASVSRKEGRGQERETRARGRREPSARDSSAGEGATSEVSLNAGKVSQRGTGEKKRGGRGRGRSNVANTDARTGGAIPAGSLAPATSPTETDEKDEVDNLTDWNVPSWTELIESLYRPER
jgi:hypothetical protein